MGWHQSNISFWVFKIDDDENEKIKIFVFASSFSTFTFLLHHLHLFLHHLGCRLNVIHNWQKQEKNFKTWKIDVKNKKHTNLTSDIGFSSCTCVELIFPKKLFICDMTLTWWISNGMFNEMMIMKCTLTFDFIIEIENNLFIFWLSYVSSTCLFTCK